MKASTTSAELYAFIITGIIIFNLFTACIIFFIYDYRKKQKDNQREKSLLHLKHQEELLKTQIEIQEQTFIHISQEIHDNIGQQLSLTKLTLGNLEMQENSDPRIAETRKLVSKAIRDLRDLSRSLNTDYVKELGLERAIEQELDIVRRSGDFMTRFSIEGDVRSADPQKELILFRMVQEGLNNIIKHAHARNINVSMCYAEKQLTIKISDDGDGFDLNASMPERSIGMRNMQNRAKLLGGHYTISSALSKGSCMKIDCPI